MTPEVIACIVVAGILAAIGIWLWATYNGFIRAKVNIEEGFASMDVFLKKRYDLIPNLVETVKGYAKHEKETLKAVIEARSAAMNATNIEDKVKGEASLTGTLKTLFALGESYPALQANTNFLSLQTQLQEVENEIAQSRRFYNAVVKVFNTKMRVFPSNFVAKMFKFKEQPMFEVESGEERQNVKVSFN